VKNIVAVLALKLLSDTSKLSHALLPSVKFLGWMWFSLNSLLAGVLQSIGDGFNPLAVERAELLNHLDLWCLGAALLDAGLNVIFPLLVVGWKADVVF